MATEKLQIILDAAWRGKGDIQQAQRDVTGLEKATRQTGLTMQNMAKVAAGVGIAIAGVGVAAKVTWDTLKQGAALERSRDQFDRLTESIGSTSDAMLGQLKAATQGMVSDAELVASAGQIISLGLAKTEEDTVRLANLVSQLGWDMQQVIMTFANNSKMRLDSLGLSVEDVEEKAKALEAQGYSMDAAFDLAVIQAGEEKLALLGSAADTTAGQMQMLETAIANVVDNARMEFAGSFTAQLGAIEGRAGDVEVALRPVIEMMGMLGKLGGGFVGMVADNQRIFEREQARNTYMAQGGVSATVDSYGSNSYWNLINESMRENVKESSAVVSATQEQIAAAVEHQFALSGVADGTEAMSEATRQQTRQAIVGMGAINEMTSATDEAEVALSGYTGTAHNAADAMSDLASATGDYFMQARKSDEFNPFEAALEAAAGKGANAYQLAQFGIAGGLFSQDEATGFMNEAFMKQQADAVGAMIAQGIPAEEAAAIIAGMEQGLAEGDILAQEFFKDLNDETVEPWLDLNDQPARDSFANLQSDIESSSTTMSVDVNYKTGGGPPGGGENTDSGRIGGRQFGGPVSGGNPYMVGESGPELFVPNSNGNIIPNNQLGGGGVTINTYTKEAAAVAMTMAWERGRRRF